MARGIWKNGLVKIFLTRSCLGFIFRPLMYSKEESIHFEFLCPFLLLTKQIVRITGTRERSLLYYWMIEIPQTLFEELFLSDENSRRLSSLLDYADQAAAVDIAYLTQGYVWDCLERLLKTDSFFRDKFGMDATELNNHIYSILGQTSPAISYQQWFSNMHDGATDLINKEIQQTFVEKMMNVLVGTSSIDEICAVREKAIRDGTAFCLWKMINAKYVTIAMLDLMEPVADRPL